MTNVTQLNDHRKTYVAFIHGNGEIGTGTIIPDGALPIVSGPEKYVVNIMNAMTFRNPDAEITGNQWAIPGMSFKAPDADNIKILLSFTKKVKDRYHSNKTLAFGSQIDVPWENTGDAQ